MLWICKKSCNVRFFCSAHTYIDPAPAPNYNCSYSTFFKAPCVTAAFSPDGSTVAVGSQDASLKVIQISKIYESGGSSDRPVIKTLSDHLGPINEVAYHPNGTVVASASDDGTIKFYDLTKAYSKRSFRFLQVLRVLAIVYK